MIISHALKPDLDSYGIKIWLLATHKPIIREASVGGKEKCFNYDSQQSGEKVTDVWRPTLKILLSHDSF